jgi:hypothetical protein
MEELDRFLQFLLENIDDRRIHIYKKMKYGFQHFYISFNIDQLDKDGTYGKRNSIFHNNSLSIVIDNRNNCIDIDSDSGDVKSIVIEDENFVKKWSIILDEFLNKEITEKISGIIDITLSSCENKNLHRDYKMKKIFKDEPIQSRRSRKNK